MRWLRLTSGGRGTSYGPVRGLIEASLRVAYRGEWPATLWSAFPGSCRVNCIHHTVPILAPGARSMRIGFVSDVHIGPTTSRKLLDAAFSRLAAERLDVLLLGGDYVFLDATEEKAELLSALVRRVPAARKIAVLGNHDLWTDHTCIERALRGAGVELLVNDSTLLEGAHGGVAIVGLDEPWTGAIDAVRAFRRVDASTAVIVLCHSPDGLPDAVRAMHARPNASSRGLFVCGHTHGGHIAAPWGPIVVPGRMGKLYLHGFHHVAPLDVYVSRGVGGIELPMRAYARPEVAVFELVGRPP